MQIANNYLRVFLFFSFFFLLGCVCFLWSIFCLGGGGGGGVVYGVAHSDHLIYLNK